MSPRLFTLLGVLLAAAACQQPPPPAPPPAAARPAEARRYFGAPPDGKLHVYFFDVGQGDAALIVSPEGHTVLVDSGPASAANHLVNRLPELLTQRLDLLILTHPHEDHFGAAEPVLRRVGAKLLMEPQLGIGPGTYDEVLNSISRQEVRVISPSPPQSTPNAPLRQSLGSGVELTVLWPRAPAESLLVLPEAEREVNSMVLRLTYGDTAVLFTGDAHARTLEHLLGRQSPMRATLLKVPAHGVEGPTTEALLEAVQPRAALISVGSDATGAPAPGTLKRLEAAGARVFRTDVDGEVQVVSDGKTLVVTPQRLPKGVPENTAYTFAGITASTALAAAPATGPTARTPKPEEPVKPVPARGTSSTGTGVDVTRYRQEAVDLDLDAPPAGQSGTRTSRPETPAPRGGTEANAVPSSSGYVASSKREVFHRPGCPAVKKIKPDNLVRYRTRQEALAQKRPAGDCDP